MDPAGARSSHVVAREASLRRTVGPSLTTRPGLPDEISFLAASGAPLAALVQAAEEAQRSRVCPVKALLALGTVSDHDYYSHLARRLGVPFVAAPPQLAGLPSSELKSGAPIARLAGGDRYLIAPEGEGLKRLLTLWRAGKAPVERIAITTPRRLDPRRLCARCGPRRSR